MIFMPDKLIIIDILSNKILLDSNNHKCINFNSSILKRYVCGCCQYENKLIINMGSNGWQAFGDIIIYDISHNKWKKIISKSKAPPKRCAHFSVIHNDTLIIGYGCGQSPNEYLDDMWEYNFLTDQWTEIKCFTKPSPRDSCGYVLINNDIYLLGGSFKNTKKNDLWKYDIIKKEWILLENNPNFALSGCKISHYNNNLYIIGGQYDSKNYNQILKYSLVNNIISKINCLAKLASGLKNEKENIIGFSPSCVINNGYLYLCNGTIDGTFSSDEQIDIYKLDDTKDEIYYKQKLFSSLINKKIIDCRIICQ